MLITRFLDRRTSQVAWSGCHTTMEGVKAELSCVGPPKERKKEQGLEMVCYEQHGHSLGTIWNTCALTDDMHYPPHMSLVPPMLLTPIAPSTLLTAHPTCTACPLTSLTQHHLAYLTCTSCFTSA